MNEPIPGQGVFWSSVGGKPYPVSLRAQSFEHLFTLRDARYNRGAGTTYAGTLRNTFTDAPTPPASAPSSASDEAEAPVDVMATIEDRAIDALRNDSVQMTKIASAEGLAWGALKAFLLVWRHVNYET